MTLVFCLGPPTGFRDMDYGQACTAINYDDVEATTEKECAEDARAISYAFLNKHPGTRLAHALCSVE